LIVARRISAGKRWLARLVLFWVTAMPSAIAGDGPVTLDAGHSLSGIEQSMRFVPDTGQSLATVVDAYRQGTLSPEFSNADDATAPYQALWAVTELHNLSFDDGRAGDSWIAVSNTYGTLKMQIYLVRQSGLTEVLLSYDYQAPFASDQFSVTRLRSQAIVLAPGERAMLLLRLVNGPVRDLSIDLKTDSALAEDSFRSGLALAAFYAFSLSSLVFFFGFHVSLRNGVGASYAVLFTLGLAFLAYIDGIFFRFLYPERPDWHLPFGLLIVNALSVGGFLTAAVAFKSVSNRSRRARAALLLALLPVATFIAYFFVPADLVVNLSYLWVVSMLALQVFAIGWWKSFGHQHLFAQAVAALTLIAVLGMLVLYVFGLWTPAFSIPVLLKWVYGVTGVLTMAGLTLAIVALRREHRRALQDRVDTLARESEQQRKLLETERAYSRARDLASLRQRQLAMASHDIRQPLASLRMTFDAQGNRFDAETRSSLSDALDYLESLSANYLVEGRPQDASETKDANVDQVMTDASGTEPYPLSIVLGAVRQMFTEEAVSKQIRLRIVNSSVQTRVDTLALMRIVSNLTSNAVKYTDRGTVLVGVRRRPDGPVIQVWDTGRGMSHDEIRRFRTAYQKGKDSSGEGLGLAICAQLAARLGLSLDIRSEVDKGSVISLALPTGSARHQRTG